MYVYFGSRLFYEWWPGITQTSGTPVDHLWRVVHHCLSLSLFLSLSSLNGYTIRWQRAPAIRAHSTQYKAAYFSVYRISDIV